MTESITLIALEFLHESATNPRKTFADAGLQELADSIRSQGLLQPIVVRPIVTQRDGDHQPHEYEIVFGHRRYRAADVAGLAEIPCIVRALSNEAAAVAQLHENLEREDVHPIEEAEAFQRLMDDHGVTADQLAAQTGKSRTYIYNRLKLATLTPEVRAACMTGPIGAEVATLIARVPRPLQHQALSRCTYKDLGQNGHPVVVRSYRDCREQLRQAFTCSLSDAPFQWHDSTLVPGASLCAECPRRSNNDPSLIELGENVCTDTVCFAAKKAAHAARELDQARAAGRVIEGEQAAALFRGQTRHTPTGFMPVDTVAWQGWMDTGVFKRITYRQELAADIGVEEPTKLIVHPSGDIIECVPTATAARIEAKLEAKMAISTPSTAARGVEGAAGDGALDAMEQPLRNWYSPDPKTPLAPTARAVLEHEPWLAVRLAILGRVSAQPRTVDDLRLLVMRELELDSNFGLAETVLGWTDAIDAADDGTAWRQAKVAEMSPNELGSLLVMIAIDDASTHYGESNRAEAADRRLALAQRYGVDVLAAAGMQDQMDEAGCAGTSQKVEAGAAGPERDPNTSDMFEGSPA
jgi:ParB/RepB/Spo0J family partition protein